MSEVLTQSGLAQKITEKTGVSIETAKKFASLFFSIVKRQLKTESSFSVYNFGTFKKSYIEDDEFDTGKRNMLKENRYME